MEKGISTPVIWLGAALSLLANPEMSGHLAHAAPASARLAEHVPGELVVRYRGGISVQSVRASVSMRIESALGAGSVLAIVPFQTDDAFLKVRVKDDRALTQAIAALKQDPSVVIAEPNFIYRSGVASTNDGSTNDPDFAKLWGLKNAGQLEPFNPGEDSRPGFRQPKAGVAGVDIGVTRLWAEGIKGSKDIVVAVIDTGVEWTHPDLVDNLYRNAGESGAWSPANDAERQKAPNCSDRSCNQIDDDKNGFVDDTHGWNFAGKNRNSSDDHDHGTHCAGTIGGVGDNGIGVVGVAHRVTLMPIKFLTASGGGTLEDAVQSIQYATKMGVQVMSNSWGGGGFSESLKLAIEEASRKGILFVAAAGNSTNDNDANPSYPASYNIPNVVSVAAMDNQGMLASFSNWGRRSVHVAAPGVRVFSTTKGGRYQVFSGTSMACPHVSGIAALMMANDSSLTFAEVKQRLIQTSVPMRSLRRRSVSNGMVNAYNAVYGIVPPSEEPDETQWKTRAYAVESKHPYDVNSDVNFTVQVPGARFVRVIFERIATERRYDQVLVKDGSGATVETLSGVYANHVSEYVAGDTLVINLKSDNTVNDWGFKVSQIQVIE